MCRVLEQLVFEFQPMLAERQLHASFRHVFLPNRTFKGGYAEKFYCRTGTIRVIWK